MALAVSASPLLIRRPLGGEVAAVVLADGSVTPGDGQRSPAGITGLGPGSDAQLHVGITHTGPVMINPAYELLH